MEVLAGLRTKQGEQHCSERPDRSPGRTAAKHGQRSVAGAVKQYWQDRSEAVEAYTPNAAPRQERPGMNGPAIGE